MRTALALSLFILITARIAQADQLPPEALTRDSSAEDVKAAITQAFEHVREHPDEADNPRMLMQLVIHSRVRDLNNEAAKLERHLLFHAPNSVEAQYLRKAIEKHGDYTKQLFDQLETEAGHISPDVIPQTARVIELGLEQFGADLLKDAWMCMLTEFVGQQIHSFELVNLAREQANEFKPKDQRIRELLLNESASNKQKFLDLADHQTHDVANFLRAYFFAQLTPEEQNSREVKILRVRDLIKTMKPIAARAELDQLIADKPEAKLEFWRIWTDMLVPRKQRDMEQISQQFERLVKAYPQSHEAEMARTLLQHLREQEDRFETQVGQVWGPTLLNPQLGSGNYIHYLVTMRGQEPDKNTRAVFRYDRSVPQFSLLLENKGRLLLAYETTDQDCRLYVYGDEQILHFQEAGFIPIAKATYKINESGTNGFDFNADLLPARDQLHRWGTLMLQGSRAFAASTFDLLENHVIMGESVSHQHGASISYYGYSVRDHKLTEVKCHFDTDQLFQRIEFTIEDKLFEIERLTEDSIIAGFDWPNLPGQDIEKFDFTAFQRILTAGANMVQTIQNEQQAAKEEKAVTR